MATIDPVVVKLQADLTDLKAGLERAESYLKDMNETVKRADSGFANFTKTVKNLGTTFGIAFGAQQVISFFRESIAEAQAASIAQERLATLLRNTNGATEAQIVALTQQAEALEKVGITSKDNIIVAQSQLATFDLAGSTIKTLTPAILDYVQAEKMGAATADDFRSMTNSLAQALQGNFASLTKTGFVLDEHTKKLISTGTESERAAAIVKVLNSTYEGFNEVMRDRNPILAAQQDMRKLKGDIGEGLKPVVESISRFISNTFIPALRELGAFIKENGNAIKIYATIVLGAVGAFKAYKAILVSVKVAQELYAVATTLMKGAQLASIASTNGLAASMLRLNAAMRANPIGIIVTALTVLGAAFVFAWNKSEKFREVAIKVAQAVANAFATVIETVAKFFNLLGKVPGMGWAKGVGEGLDNISGKIKETSKNFENFKDKVIGKGKGKDEDPFAGDTRGDKKTLTDKERKELEKRQKQLEKDLEKRKKLLEKYQKEVEKINGKIADAYKQSEEDKAEALDRYNERKKDATERFNETLLELQDRHNERIKDAQERFDEASQNNLDRYNERVADITENYNDKVADITERYLEKLADIQERFEETKAELKQRREEAEENATKRHAETILKINSDFAKRQFDLQKARDKKLADLQEAAQRKTEEITKRGAERLAAIVEKSRDRLRSAWQSGTQFSLADLFDMSKNTKTNILETLRTQLKSIKEFQLATIRLSKQGFAQTFIEEIVKAGPTAGLQMIEQINKLTPLQQKELQALYSELEILNTEGMDVLASTLSTSSKLATKALTTEYEKAQADIADALANVNKELLDNIAEAKAAYEEAFSDAKAMRDKALAEADKDFNDALLKSKTDYDKGLEAATKAMQKAQDDAKKIFDKGLEDAKKALDKAMEDAKKTYDKGLVDAKTALEKAIADAKAAYDKGLTDAQATLAKAIMDAQETYNKAIDEIDKKTQEKIDALLAKLAQARALMATLGATIAGGGTQGYIPPKGAYYEVDPINSAPEVTPATKTAITLQQSFSNVTADVPTITAATLSAINYGTAMVTV